ncbi:MULTISPECIES: 3'-5' exonuclease [unclassified Sphingobium]|uniref:3'-5' exonuclease n=1 Tax=unclassified Sphingobium TaxID=2611147 RepID=UPI00077051F5|nr:MULTISPECIES: hypothetical protein [unclassified Sphingobium]AMK25272.1 hypothetical protein K426_21824 [Sphingobium sp. TKS]
MALMDYVTIDFEASCLPHHGRSFPIEVGIADAQGARAWLIRPIAEWRKWDWTQEALELHGIGPERLEREGMPPHQVFAELNRAIGSRRIIADSRIDGYWWRLLAGAAGEVRARPIEHVASVLDALAVASEDIFSAQKHADRLCPARHRAADDARWLWTLLAELERRVDAMSYPAHLPSDPARESRSMVLQNP